MGIEWNLSREDQYIYKKFKDSTYYLFTRCNESCKFWVLEQQTRNLYSEIYDIYSQPHRRYHNIRHIYDILKYFDEASECKVEDWNPRTEFFYHCSVIAIIFHDICYDPNMPDDINIKDSITFLNKKFIIFFAFSDNVKKIIESIIMTTNSKYLINGNFNNLDIDELNENNVVIDAIKKDLSNLLVYEADTHILFNDNVTYTELIEYEESIFKEFQMFPFEKYKKERLNILTMIKDNNIERTSGRFNSNIDFLIQYLKNKKIKVGLYAGSFNPFHKGHYDILKQAEKIFDKIIIFQGKNYNIKYTQSIDEVYSINLSHTLKYYEKIESYDTLLDVYNKVKTKDVDVTLIRGLRNGSDLQYEMNFIKTLDELNKEKINFITLFPDKQYEHISSSLIRELKCAGFNDENHGYTIN